MKKSKIIQSENLQYICFFPNQDFWDPIIDNLSQYENVIFNKHIESNIKGYIHKIHNSMRINRRIKLPLKKLWYKEYLDYKMIDKNKDSIFLFIEGTNIAYDYAFIKHLKNNFPKSKFAYYFVNTIPEQNKYSVPNLSQIMENYDMVIAFDKDDASRYDIAYYSGIYSNKKIVLNDEKESDLLFIGKNKGRIDVLHKIFDQLNAENLKCDFHITGVPQNKQLYPDRISYNQYLPYEEVIKKVIKTKCILELIYNDRNNCTLRTRESIMYNKKLITNNVHINKMNFYDENYISILNTENVIDLDFIKKCTKVDYSDFREEFLPKNFLVFISDHIVNNGTYSVYREKSNNYE